MSPNIPSSACNYTALLYIFQYLNVQDLLKARRVCTIWRDVADDRLLWRTVRIKNCQIRSFEGLADTLQKYGTLNFDLRGMCPPRDRKDFWLFPRSFSCKKIDFLKRIELCPCPAAVVEHLGRANPNLEKINASNIQTPYISLNDFANCINLRELTLKFTEPFGFIANTDFSPLKKLKHLRHLSLTSFNNLFVFIDVITYFSDLQSLELGHCMTLPNRFASDILTKLTKLEKLRLEWIIHHCLTLNVLKAVKRMPQLEQLELVNIRFGSGFDKALRACTNIKKLLIISAGDTPNDMILSGVLGLQSALSHFVWGVTSRQLRRFHGPLGILSSDDILLEPIPIVGKLQNQLRQGGRTIVCEVSSLPILLKLLRRNLPRTRVEVLKIAFGQTWGTRIIEILDS